MSVPPEANPPETSTAAPESGSMAAYLFEAMQDRPEDRRRLRWVTVVAIALHLVLFWVQFPEWHSSLPENVREAKIYVVQSVRLRQPSPPPAAGAAQPTRAKRKIPIPDPTPDDPEPIVELDLVVPETPITQLNDVFFGIPSAAPGPPGLGDGTGPTGTLDFTGDAFQVGAADGVSAPIPINRPEPRYTEEARRARIQGIVILSCIVDEQGAVRNIRVVKGLELGLSESAVTTVSKEWRYKPALKNGKPVPVHFIIRVSFSLQ